MPECVFGALYENYEYILPPSKIERVRSDDSNVAEELQATVWRISCRGLLQITENTLLIPNSVRLNHIFCLHSLRFLQNYREYPSPTFQIQAFSLCLCSILSPPFPIFCYLHRIFSFYCKLKKFFCCSISIFFHYHLISIFFPTSGWSFISFCSFIILIRFPAIDSLQGKNFFFV